MNCPVHEKVTRSKTPVITVQLVMNSTPVEYQRLQTRGWVWLSNKKNTYFECESSWQQYNPVAIEKVVTRTGKGCNWKPLVTSLNESGLRVARPRPGTVKSFVSLDGRSGLVRSSATVPCKRRSHEHRLPPLHLPKQPRLGGLPDMQ